MKHATRKTLLLALTLLLAFPLTGCRVRLRSGDSIQAAQSPSAEERTAPLFPEVSEANPSPEDGEPGDRSRENPEAERKEYDENAAAEIEGEARNALHQEGQGSGAPLADLEADTAASQLREQAEEEARQTVRAEQAERLGVAPDAEEADSALTYYTALLRDRMSSLFECQRLKVYWETEADHVTIHKSSPEHELILSVGALDVSARLLPENLQVDNGWAARKNPDVIVKVVDSGTLGKSAVSLTGAKNVYRELLQREGWQDMSAVKNRRVALLSAELLRETPMRTFSMLVLAKTANPELMQDVDLRQALAALMEESTGALPTGSYYYTGTEE